MPWPRPASTTTAPPASICRAAPRPRRTIVAMAPTVTPLRPDESALAAVRYDERGLVPAIVQEEGTGQVLMMAWMNADSLRETLDTGRTCFWSRSRQEFWRKGDTSGDRQYVRDAYYDCDGDTLLFVVEQEGRGACHTGERSCFYRRLAGANVSAAPA